RVDVPSIRLKVGDVLTVRPKSQGSEYFKKLDEVSPAGEENGASWLKVNRKKFEFSVTGMPIREEMEPDINEQLIVEYYSR
ncbi:MAG: 30S ribosomal protein S4, partial [Candidatus Saccharimonadales bacterium]